jgi:hypothetical protein
MFKMITVNRGLINQIFLCQLVFYYIQLGIMNTFDGETIK